MATVALGLGYGASHAKGEGEASDVGVPTAQQTKEALESPNPVKLEESAETDQQAASELPHRELGREEALELVESVFESELESPAGIFDELEPERFLSNYAAAISSSSLPEPPGQEIGDASKGSPVGQPVLLESSLPLRAENSEGQEEAVDLSLQHSEGELQPQNPLAEVGVPTQLGEGISLPAAEAQISIVGAPETRSPSDVEQQYAFYPNIAENTDLIVAPSPTGVETMADIRSAEAPQTTIYRLTLPGGASLESSPGGGAEVVQGGRTTIAIPAPSATDAAGDSVPAEMHVDGNQLAVTITPGPSAQFPILVDPTFIIEPWHWTLQHDSLSAWTPSTNTTSIMPVPQERWNPTWYPGPDLTSGFPGSANPGSHAD